jgi:hypothetical protein
MDSVEDRAFHELEPKLAALAQLHASRDCTVLNFFRLQDEDSQHNMSSAILHSLFSNLMYNRNDSAETARSDKPMLCASRRPHAALHFARRALSSAHSLTGRRRACLCAVDSAQVGIVA